MKWQLNTYLLSVSWVESFLSLSLHHLFIHEIIISYPNAKMDKRFFKNGFLHIHHHLRDILWITRAWFSVAPIFSSLYYESSFFLCALFPEFVEGNHFLLAHIPRMNESHDLGSPFKVVIKISSSSSIASSHHQTLPLVSSRMTCEGC